MSLAAGRSCGGIVMDEKQALERFDAAIQIHHEGFAVADPRGCGGPRLGGVARLSLGKRRQPAAELLELAKEFQLAGLEKPLLPPEFLLNQLQGRDVPSCEDQKIPVLLRILQDESKGGVVLRDANAVGLDGVAVGLNSGPDGLDFGCINQDGSLVLRDACLVLLDDSLDGHQRIGNPCPVHLRVDKVSQNSDQGRQSRYPAEEHG